MSNKEEYEKILEIVDVSQYSGEKEFVDNCATKFKNVRNAFYIVLFTELFYLYKAAKECNDLQNINTFSGFVSANAGTTWYGSAITDGFVPVVKPDNYPAFIADQDRLNNPSKIDNSRKKYILLGVVAVLIMYLVSYTIKTFNL